MAITHGDLGTTEEIGLRVLARARVIAPCLDSLTDEAKKTAIAILKGVVSELPGVGVRRAKSLSRDGTAITFDTGAMFSQDDEASLRALCSAASGASTGPQPKGAFPLCTVSQGLWPEERYS